MLTRLALRAYDLLAIGFSGRTLLAIDAEDGWPGHYRIGELKRLVRVPIVQRAELDAICLCAMRMHEVIEENRRLREAVRVTYNEYERTWLPEEVRATIDAIMADEVVADD